MEAKTPVCEECEGTSRVPSAYNHDQTVFVPCLGCVSSVDRAIAAVDEQLAEMPPAASAGRSHLGRQRMAEWVALQVERTRR